MAASEEQQQEYPRDKRATSAPIYNFYKSAFNVLWDEISNLSVQMRNLSERDDLQLVSVSSSSGLAVSILSEEDGWKITEGGIATADGIGKSKIRWRNDLRNTAV